MSAPSSSPPSSRDAQILEYGWTSQSCDPSAWGGNKEYNHAPKPQLCADVPLPDTPLARRALSFMKSELPAPTYNHSLRVFHYGMAIASQQFPSWDGLFSAETWLLTCLFHDIGTIDKHTHGTLMSFEFFGGFLALRELEGMGAPKRQRESVAEAIVRHQDPVETGRITTVGLLVQVATQFDNMAYHPGFVHPDTIADVVKHYPRLGWSGCFSSKIREEVAVKPWCHTTALGEAFPRDTANNELMKKFE